LTGWISTILEGFPRNNTDNKNNLNYDNEDFDDEGQPTIMAHEDPDLPVTHNIFCIVMASIATTKKSLTLMMNMLIVFPVKY
jgi:hypothetical protein